MIQKLKSGNRLLSKHLKLMSQSLRHISISQAQTRTPRHAVCKLEVMLVSAVCQGSTVGIVKGKEVQQTTNAWRRSTRYLHLGKARGGMKMNGLGVLDSAVRAILPQTCCVVEETGCNSFLDGIMVA